eukprot:2284567-Pyramimonas_sp.AAC.1
MVRCRGRFRGAFAFLATCFQVVDRGMSACSCQSGASKSLVKISAARSLAPIKRRPGRAQRGALGPGPIRRTGCAPRARKCLQGPSVV